MRASSHRQLALSLAEIYFPNLSKRYLQAFLLGCTQPDKNPTTYLKGSLRNRWLHGHDFPSARRYILRLACRLQRRKVWRTADYYNLGKLLHYTADAFTYTHSQNFSGGLIAHRRYEKHLHARLLLQLSAQCRPYPKHSPYVAKTIQKYYCRYVQCAPNVQTDTDYILGVCFLVAEMLNPK